MKIDQRRRDAALHGRAERDERQRRARSQLGAQGAQKETPFARLLGKSGQRERSLATDRQAQDAPGKSELVRHELEESGPTSSLPRTLPSRADDSLTADRADRRHQAESGAAFAADGTRDDRVLSESKHPGIDTAHVALDSPPPGLQHAQPTQAAEGAHDVRSGELERLVNQLVEKLQASDDVRARKTIVMQLDVGPDGQVAVRLRRSGSGFDLRMRPTDPTFAARLEQHQGDLRRAAASSGLRFTRIDVVK